MSEASTKSIPDTSSAKIIGLKFNEPSFRKTFTVSCQNPTATISVFPSLLKSAVAV